MSAPWWRRGVFTKDVIREIIVEVNMWVNVSIILFRQKKYMNKEWIQKWQTAVSQTSKSTVENAKRIQGVGPRKYLLLRCRIIPTEMATFHPPQMSKHRHENILSNTVSQEVKRRLTITGTWCKRAVSCLVLSRQSCRRSWLPKSTQGQHNPWLLKGKRK